MNSDGLRIISGALSFFESKSRSSCEAISPTNLNGLHSEGREGDWGKSPLDEEGGWGGKLVVGVMLTQSSSQTHKRKKERKKIEFLPLQLPESSL